MIIITEDQLDIQSFTDYVVGDENGAINTFLGVTRNVTDGKAVLKLEYECYLPMAQKTLEQIYKIISNIRKTKHQTHNKCRFWETITQSLSPHKVWGDHLMVC